MFSVRNNKKIECVLFCYCCCFLPGFALLLCSTQPFLILTTLIYQIRLQHLPFGTPPSSVLLLSIFISHLTFTLEVWLSKNLPSQTDYSTAEIFLSRTFNSSIMKWHQQMHSVGFQLHLDAFHRARERVSESSCSSFKMIKNLQLLQQYCNPGIFFLPLLKFCCTFKRAKRAIYSLCSHF